MAVFCSVFEIYSVIYSCRFTNNSATLDYAEASRGLSKNCESIVYGLV